MHAFGRYRRQASVQAGVQAGGLASLHACIMDTTERKQEYSSVLPTNPSAPDPAQTPVQSSCQVAVLQPFMHECMKEGPPGRAGGRRASKGIGS